MNFLGIYREPEYSPGRHMSNDAKILRLVGPGAGTRRRFRSAGLA